MAGRSKIKELLVYLTLGCLGALTFLPFLLMFHISFKNNAQVYAYFWSFKGLKWEIVKENYLRHIYDPGVWIMKREEVLEWKTFAGKLVTAEQGKASEAQPGGAPAAAKRIWDVLNEDARKIFREAAINGAPAKEVKDRAVAALNEALNRRDLLRQEDFAGLSLSDKAGELTKRDRASLSKTDIQQLNRSVLESAFPTDLAKTRRTGSPLQFRIGDTVILDHVGKIAWSIWNSLFVSTVTVTGVLFFSSLTAYVFARFPFAGRKPLFFLILALIMIPAEFSIVPLYLAFKKMGLINSLWGLILPYWAGGQVVSIYILRGFFEGIPQDLFDSAKIDGAGEFSAYRLIALPLSKPILTTVGLMTFLGTWNDFIWPSLILGDQLKWTLAVQLRSLQGEYAIEFGEMMAGYSISCIPILILFFFTMNYFVKGLTSGAIKA